jgi:hypothetical protein
MAEAFGAGRRSAMREIMTALLGRGILCSGLRAQGDLEPHPYMHDGVIAHQHGTATVKADAPRPLQQAITAMREEYGWVVSYEDPPYQSNYDVTDMRNPKYRAAHPNTPVVLGPAGRGFQSTYPEVPDMWSSPATEEQVLEKVVSDYNKSGNPGNFVVRRLPDGSFDIVGDSVHDDNGVDVRVMPVLDTPVDVPQGTRTLSGTINAILHALSAKTGYQMGIAIGPMAFLTSPAATLALGGQTVPARDLLMQATGALWNRNYVLLFLYQPGSHKYLLGWVPAGRAEYDAFGNKRLLPIGPPTTPPGGPQQ